MNKSTILGVTVGVIGTIAAIKYRKQLKRKMGSVADSVSDIFLKKKQQVVAEVPAPAAESPVPVVEVPAPAAESPVPVVEVSVSEDFMEELEETMRLEKLCTDILNRNEKSVAEAPVPAVEVSVSEDFIKEPKYAGIFMSEDFMKALRAMDKSVELLEKLCTDRLNRTEKSVAVESVVVVEADVVLNDAVVDVMAARAEMTPTTAAAVVAVAEEAIVVLEELEKSVTEATKSPEEVAAATTAAMLELAGKIGKELADEEVSKVRLVEPSVMVSPELGVKLEKAMNSLPAQPYKQQHNKRHHQRR